MFKHLIVMALVMFAAMQPAHARRADSTSRGCLTHETRSLLEQAEAHFRTEFKLVSTCRPGATIAGTHHASEHRYGKAVDLEVPRGVVKKDVVSWFYEHAPGVTMTYRHLSHVHFDTGPFHKLACGGCGRHRYTRTLHARRSHVARL